MSQYEPSPIGLALLEGIADAEGKDAAMATIQSTRKYIERVLADLAAEHGPKSLYVMQSLGEIAIATVAGTVSRIAAQQRH